MVRIILITAALVIVIMAAGVFWPVPIRAGEWLGAIGATLRDQHAAPGEYRYGKATITFNGRKVVKLVQPDGRVVDHRERRKHRK